MYKVMAMFVVAVALLVISAFTAMSTRDFLQTAIPASGLVVSLNAGGSHPQIEFVTRAGERISYPQGGMIYGMKVGNKVTVLYRADAPAETATIDRLGAVWNWTLLLLILSAGTFLAALTNIPSKK